jgi:hypothetical protein
MARSRGGLRPETATLVRVLDLDRVAAEVADAFKAAGIDSILLKGASLADWLYQRHLRPYTDVDLLVPISVRTRAEHVLAERGFADVYKDVAPSERVSYATGWRREHTYVDLHHSVLGAMASPEVVWETFSAYCGVLTIGGTELKVLLPPALACVCALHAAQHGPNDRGPLEDLDRALARGSIGVWRDAKAVAAALDAMPAFQEGLRLVPRGAALAQELGLQGSGAPIDVLIRLESSPSIVHGLEQLRETNGAWSRGRLLVRKLVPTPSALRRSWSFARRNRVTLVLSYLWRPIWIMAGALPALIRWARLRRQAAGYRARGPGS